MQRSRKSGLWTALMGGALVLLLGAGPEGLELSERDRLSGLREEIVETQPTGLADANAPELSHHGLETALRERNPRLDADLSSRIAGSVARCSREEGIDSHLVLAVLLVESGGRPHAKSPKGAIGLMQVMPGMYQAMGFSGSVAHIEANIEAGCRLLADNIRRWGESRGISAYFWGSNIQGDGYLERVRSVADDLAPELITADDSRHG
jgi:hypothetical protein